jgi:hypothetical protein
MQNDKVHVHEIYSVQHLYSLVKILIAYHIEIYGTLKKDIWIHFEYCHFEMYVTEIWVQLILFEFHNFRIYSSFGHEYNFMKAGRSSV